MPAIAASSQQPHKDARRAVPTKKTSMFASEMPEGKIGATVCCAIGAHFPGVQVLHAPCAVQRHLRRPPQPRVRRLPAAYAPVQAPPATVTARLRLMGPTHSWTACAGGLPRAAGRVWLAHATGRQRDGYQLTSLADDQSFTPTPGDPHHSPSLLRACCAHSCRGQTQLGLWM